MKKHALLSGGLLLIVLLSFAAYAKHSTCRSRFVNPVTDICWNCLFPISIGAVPVADTTLAPDTKNPSSPVQICPAPVGERVGIALGYWEPEALVDVTRSPGCMVNMGFSLKLPFQGSGGGYQSDAPDQGSFYHLHWYKYPLVYWLNILTDAGCMQQGDMDVAYLTELDPAWNDDELAAITNPEAVLFSNPITQMACAADALASTTHLPLNALFWCAGSQGSLYPFTGHTSNEFSPLQSSVLLAERLDYKLHRQGLTEDTSGKDGAVCFRHYSPIMPKNRYRYQMVNPLPDASSCHPFGQTVLRWETGHITPDTSKDFGYLIWRKRNCVMF